jgi:hypothetical protein
MQSKVGNDLHRQFMFVCKGGLANCTHYLANEMMMMMRYALRADYIISWI